MSELIFWIVVFLLSILTLVGCIWLLIEYEKDLKDAKKLVEHYNSMLFTAWISWMGICVCAFCIITIPFIIVVSIINLIK